MHKNFCAQDNPSVDGGRKAATIVAVSGGLVEPRGIEPLTS